MKTIPLASLANNLTVYLCPGSNAINESTLIMFLPINYPRVRKSLRLYCPMDLQKFPMDKQICEMEFVSCKYFNTYKCCFFTNHDSVASSCVPMLDSNLTPIVGTQLCFWTRVSHLLSNRYHLLLSFIQFLFIQ